MAEFIGRNGKTWSCEERQVVSSIFDTNWAGQHDTNGKYWCIMTDHKTHENYCVESDVRHQFYMNAGRMLEYGETAVFNNEEVRGMSISEQMDYNMERVTGLVDCWGNLSTNSEATNEYLEWYYENIF